MSDTKFMLVVQQNPGDEMRRGFYYKELNARADANRFVLQGYHYIALYANGNDGQYMLVKKIERK